MAASLEELLAGEGFKGRRLMTTSRASLKSDTVGAPRYSFSTQAHMATVPGDRHKTERAKSDVSRFSLRGKLSNSVSARSRRTRDILDKRGKIDGGFQNEKRERFFRNVKVGRGFKDNLSEYVPENEITEVGEEDDQRVKDICSNEMYSSERGENNNFREAREEEKLREMMVNNKMVDKRQGNTPKMHMLERLSFSENNRKSMKQPRSSYDRSNLDSWNSKSSEDICESNQDHAVQAGSEVALDEVAVRAMVSILNGYIKRFLKDEDFRATLRHNCFSSLNFIELEEGHDSEIKVIMSLEQAVEIVEQAAEESASAKDLKKASLQLSVITGLSLNDMKEGFTCGIPNCKLSACAHLYLSVVYKIQKKERVSAKHLLQVFCDSPSQARTTLLPELWDCLFFPHLSHVKVWYSQKADILADTLSRTRKLKLLEKLYNEILDSGTYQFAMYYKDWLTEGLEVPSIPSIEIPSLSVGEIQSGSSLGHSSDLVSPIDPFSPQPMVSKKLYDAVFGCLSKPGVPEDEDSKEDEKLEWGQISDGSAVIRQTITCLSEIIKNIAQDIEEDCTKSAPVVAFPENGISRTTEEKWRFHICGVPPERSFRDDNGYPISLRRTTLNSNMPKALSQAKENELTLKRLAKSVLAMQITESSSDPSVSTVSLSSEGSVSNSLQSKTSSSSEELNGLNEYFDEEPFFSSIPLDFICPLTGKLFEEPVTLETGQTFDRVAIKAWFEQGNRTCPVTGNTLECVAVPLSNFVLKRLIDNWKSEHCRHLLAFASQTVETSEEHRFKQGDEAAVFIIENLLCAFSGEEKKTTAKRLISIGGVQYLLRRFELGKMEEKTRVVTLLLSCIEADSDCRYQIAKNINRQCLLRLLESNQVRPRTNAVLLLTELICLERRKDVYSFLSGLQNESVVNLVNALLLFLRSSQPQLKALVAVLLLHFDLLVEHNKYSIYREEAVDAITVALDASLTDENIRKNCCRALLILEGHFSSSSKLLTGTSILKQAVFCDSVEMKSLDDEEEGLRVEDSVLLAGEKERNQERLRNLLEYLVGDEKRSFLETICRCLHSRNLDLVSVCLTTVAWLSSALSLLHDAGSHFITMSSLISPLKYILENDENVEHKMLASLSLLNFSNLPECRVLLLTILEDLAGPLERLAEVTWTAKKLHTLMIGREL